MTEFSHKASLTTTIETKLNFYRSDMKKDKGFDIFSVAAFEKKHQTTAPKLLVEYISPPVQSLVLQMR